MRKTLIALLIIMVVTTVTLSTYNLIKREKGIFLEYPLINDRIWNLKKINDGQILNHLAQIEYLLDNRDYDEFTQKEATVYALMIFFNHYRSEEGGTVEFNLKEFNKFVNRYFEISNYDISKIKINHWLIEKLEISKEKVRLTVGATGFEFVPYQKIVRREIIGRELILTVNMIQSPILPEDKEEIVGRREFYFKLINGKLKLSKMLYEEI